jgi:hypothetical protein
MKASSLIIGGWLLIVTGVIYILKPDIFKRGIWKETDIAQRKLSPEGYLKYMRFAAAIYIATGVLLLLFGYAKG